MLRWLVLSLPDRALSILLNMSITGGLAILGVLAVRFLLRRAPKIFSYALWGIVLFRLLCPFSFSAPFSVLGLVGADVTEGGAVRYFSVENLFYLPEEGHWQKVAPEDPAQGTLAQWSPTSETQTPETVASGFPKGEFPKYGMETSEKAAVSAQKGTLAQTGAPEQEETGNAEIFRVLFRLFWLAGVIVLLVVNVASYFRMRFRVSCSMPLRDNIYLADGIGTAFCLGIINPRIYLPSSLSEAERKYVILHEQHHILRCDHIIRVLAFLALCLHWLNPLVWVAFVLAGRDMEMSCDEAVMKKMDADIRAEYSTSLLQLATGRQFSSLLPLAFGEGDPKRRIRNVMNYKKPQFWVLVAAFVLCVTVIICLAANPQRDAVPGQSQSQPGDTAEPVSSGETILQPRSQAQDWNGKLLGQVYADVCGHDGQKDLIQIWLSDVRTDEEKKADPGENLRDYMGRGEEILVEVYQQERFVYEFTVGCAHEGWSNLGLMRRDGQDYLITYENALWMGQGNYGYCIFWFDESGEPQLLEQEGCAYTVEPDLGEISGLAAIPEFFAEQMPLEQLEELEQKLDDILPEVTVLASGDMDGSKCYAYQYLLEEQRDWKEMRRLKEQTGLEVFQQGAPSLWTGYKDLAIREYYTRWMRDAAYTLTEDVENNRMDGLTVYGRFPSDGWEYLLADYIPGDSIQLVRQKDGKTERLKQWYKGEDYMDPAASGRGPEHFSLYKYENLMGYEEVLAVWFQVGYQSDIYYYPVGNGDLEEIALCFGTGIEHTWQVDLDGDGSRELICENQYYADGAWETAVFWNRQGKVMKGDTTSLLREKYDSFGVGSLYAEYLPDTNQVRIHYYPQKINSFQQKDYPIVLEEMEWY